MNNEWFSDRSDEKGPCLEAEAAAEGKHRHIIITLRTHNAVSWIGSTLTSRVSDLVRFDSASRSASLTLRFNDVSGMSSTMSAIVWSSTAGWRLYVLLRKSWVSDARS